MPVNNFPPAFPAWITNASDGDNSPGMAMHLEQKVACGATWLSTTPPTLALGGHQTAPVTVTADSTKFASGTAATGYVCLQSNDTTKPIVVVQVKAVQN